MAKKSQKQEMINGTSLLKAESSPVSAKTPGFLIAKIQMGEMVCIGNS